MRYSSDFLAMIFSLSPIFAICVQSEVFWELSICILSSMRVVPVCNKPCCKLCDAIAWVLQDLLQVNVVFEWHVDMKALDGRISMVNVKLKQMPCCVIGSYASAFQVGTYLVNFLDRRFTGCPPTLEANPCTIKALGNILE